MHKISSHALPERVNYIKLPQSSYVTGIVIPNPSAGSYIVPVAVFMSSVASKEPITTITICYFDDHAVVDTTKYRYIESIHVGTEPTLRHYFEQLEKIHGNGH